MQKQILVTVITPTWNRAHLLTNVWASLESQTYKNFEWIIGNDGSTDGTDEIVRELALKSKFNITLISASQRIGKSSIDNYAIDHASGDFIIWCDSDDVFHTNTIETLINAWNMIPIQKQNDYCGVTALCVSNNKLLGNKFYSNNIIDLTWNELYYKLKSDLVIFTRSELLKNNKFIEVDFLISESSVWNKIGYLKTKFIPLGLQTKHYNQNNALSFSGNMSYNRGHAYAISITKKYTDKYYTFSEKIKQYVNFFRYAFHGDINFTTALIILCPPILHYPLIPLLIAISFILILKDNLQKKVIKTHIEFNKSRKNVSFKIEKFNA